MTLFSTGDGYPSPETLFTMRLNNDVWAKRALIEALFLLSQPYNWFQQGSVTPDEAAETFAEAMQHISFGDGMIGSIVPYITTSPPDLCIDCDGSTYNRVDYPLLYVALDSAYVVDADHFTTPDLNGRVIVGAGLSSSGTTFSVNSVGGEEHHTLIESEMPAHVHAYDPVVVGDLDVEGAGIPQPNAAQIIPAITENTYSTGGGDAHNNIQPYIALKWAIVAR